MTTLLTHNPQGTVRRVPTIVTILTDALIQTKFGSFAKVEKGTTRVVIVKVSAFRSSGFKNRQQLVEALNIHLRQQHRFSVSAVTYVAAHDLGEVQVTIKK